MSGRSAYVRAKKNEIAEKTERRRLGHYNEHDDFIYGLSGNPAPRPSVAINGPYISPSHHAHHRRHSVSDGGSIYAYSPQPYVHRKAPRPIVIVSAIEKSDIRSNVDGLSKSIRGAIGRFMKGGGDHHSTQRARQSEITLGSDRGSHSSGFTPSVTAVPSLIDGPAEDKSEMTVVAPSTYGQRPKHQNSMNMPIRRFEGGGKGPQPGWKLLSNNPELWDENGDTYVYMYMRGSRTKPPPSFRISSTTIYESGSKIFINQLRDRSVPQGWPRFCPSDIPSPEETATGEDMISSMELPRHLVTKSGTYLDTDSIYSNRDPYKRLTANSDDGILHEIYIPWPGPESGVQSTLWHITTRNFFAVLCDADSLIGTTLYECLMRLYERVDANPDYMANGTNKVSFITDFIIRHKFDDVRNNPNFAASILAFSEHADIQWKEGYTEAFVHCVGMLNMGLKTVPEWRLITAHTKMFLHNASLELEERLHRAQAWLFSFDFTEMWPTTSAPPSSSHAAFDRFRKWLCKYYEKAFLHWPPTANDHTWLTRDMLVRLRRDFYGLYDYLVDRDIIFDGTEYRPGQKWAIISKSGQTFRADTVDLPMTDILLGFDDRHKFPHIPHPYPHTPTSVPVTSKPKSSFHLKKPATASEILAVSRRKALSYSEASNVYVLRNQYMHTDLVTTFIAFEQTDLLDAVDPFEARRGRWLLIYAVLQVLATVAVDSPNLRHAENVHYHLSPQMKGVVPWAEPGTPPEDEACHTRSHCWTVPATWAPHAPKAKPGSHKPIIWGQFGDGRSRAGGDEPNPSPPPTTAVYSAPKKVRETTSMGRIRVDVRVDEWVATTRPGVEPSETNNDVMSMSEADCTSMSGAGRSGEGEGKTEDGRKVSDEPMSIVKMVGSSVSGPGEAESSTGDSGDSAVIAARRRRARIHGFTDFKVPAEW